MIIYLLVVIYQVMMVESSMQGELYNYLHFLAL